MFKKNKYTTVYFKIIERAIVRNSSGYVERHHVIPRSIGGSNIPSNIVCLTAREHFICHRLLIKMVDGSNIAKMAYAAWQQSRSAKHKGVIITSRTYETLRKNLSESYTGRKRAPFSDEWKAKMKKFGKDNPRFGTKHSPESIQKMSQNRKGKTTGRSNPFFGKSHPPNVLEKIRQVNKRVYTCPHCLKTGQSNVMYRFHFDNCKMKISPPFP